MIMIIKEKKYEIDNEIVNLEEKNITFNIKDVDNEFYQFINYYFWGSNYMIEYIDIESDKKITIYNCYFSKNKEVITLKFDTAIVGMHSNNFDDIKLSSLYAKINHTKYKMSDMEEFIKDNINFKNKKYCYSIGIVYYPRECSIKLTYNGKITVKKLTNEFLNFFEYFCFICGCSFELKELYYEVNGLEIKKLLNLNSKYNMNKKNLHTNEVIIDYNNIDIKETYKKWNEIREKSHLILDIYECSMDDSQFYELSLATLLNCMEGYIKSIHINWILELENSKLDTIIEKTYCSSKNSILIFNNAERKKLNLFDKLAIHRNYFDHLDRVQKSFLGKKCRYVFLKCDLLFRLIILQDIGIEIDTERLKKNIEKIDKKY